MRTYSAYIQLTLQNSYTVQYVNRSQKFVPFTKYYDVFIHTKLHKIRRYVCTVQCNV
jgi:hypothetical protein